MAHTHTQKINLANLWYRDDEAFGRPLEVSPRGPTLCLNAVRAKQLGIERLLGLAQKENLSVVVASARGPEETFPGATTEEIRRIISVYRVVEQV